MNQKIVEFTGKIGRGDTAFFFYSGHGVEIRGVNYLLAVDTPAANDGQEGLITSEGIPADTIIDQLQERGAKISMLVLDACRCAHPGVEIRAAVPVGEDDAVLDALVAYCLRQLGSLG